MGFFSFFKKDNSKEKEEVLDKGLAKTKESVFGKISRAIVGKSKVDDEVLDNLEEILITSDVGVDTTLRIIERIQDRVARDKYVGTDELHKILREEIVALLAENNLDDLADIDYDSSENPYVILVVGVNGVGKTTTAVNIATAMAAIGKRVLILDMDPQGNATTSLGINKNKCLFSTYDLMINSCKIEDAIVKTDIKKFAILPSAPALAAAEIELIDVNKREYVLKNALNSLNGKYDYVLIDCPPSLNLITINALVSSDSVIVPLQSEFLALEGLTDLVKNINIIKKNFNPKLDLQGIVLTMYDRRNNLSQMVEKDVRKYFGTKVYNTVIPRSVRISEAPSHGMPVLIYDFKSTGAKAYLSLAKEVLKREKEI